MLTSLLVASVMCIGGAATSFASEIPEDTSMYYSIEFENDSMLENATKIDEKTIRENGRISTITTYILEDGTRMVDTFTRGDNLLSRSKSGSDTATRTRSLDEWGSISLTASFSWRTEGMFSYVKCTSASASKNLSSQAAVSTWDLTKTSDEVSIGTAKASIKYYIYNTIIHGQHRDGTLTIKCSDSGTISDNA